MVCPSRGTLYDVWTPSFPTLAEIYCVTRASRLTRAKDSFGVYPLRPRVSAYLESYGRMTQRTTQQLREAVVDLYAVKPLGISGFIQILRGFLGGIFARPLEFSSYSMRRVGPTWAVLAELQEANTSRYRAFNPCLWQASNLSAALHLLCACPDPSN